MLRRLPTTCLLVTLAGATSGLLSAPLEAERLLLRAGRVIEGSGDTMLRDQTVIVEGDRITAIEPGFRRPVDGDKVIDLRDHTLLPGMIQAAREVNAVTRFRLLNRRADEPHPLLTNRSVGVVSSDRLLPTAPPPSPRSLTGAPDGDGRDAGSRPLHRQGELP